MRIAVVSPFVDRRHGTERALAEALERLAQDRGCEIHLYAQRVDELRVKDPRAGRGAQAGGIYWHRVRSVGGPHVVQFLAWMFLNGWQRKWDGAFGGGSYDAVLSPGINCLRADVVIVHVLFQRLRELAREAEGNAAERGGVLRRLHRKIYYGLLTLLERRVYTDRRVQLAAVSRRMGDLLKRYYGREDARIVQNGVDTKEFCTAKRLARRAEARRSRGFREEECVLLLIGNDWRVKGLPTVLEAMAALRDLPLRLVVVGSDAADYFQAMAGKLGMRERCEWEAPSADVMEFYAAADVYVSPSLEDSFALPVAEAMACGLPVITSRSAGVADQVKDGADGFVMDEPRDVRALAEILRALVADEQLRRKIGEAAAGKAATWSWNEPANVIWELVKSAADRRSGSRTS